MRAFFCLFVSVFFTAQLKAQEKLFTCGVFEKDACVDYQKWNQYIINRALVNIDSLASGTYTINLHLLIDTSGKVSVIKILDDPGYGIGATLKLVIERCPYKWQPAERNGRKVKNYRKQPVTLIIEEEEKCSESTALLML